QGYSVLGSHAGGFDQRKKVNEGAFQLAAEAREAFLERGLPVEIVTGGSTGSWNIDTQIPIVTELQAGSYVFMDMAYRKGGLDFRHALTVLATVVSANHISTDQGGFVTVDAGYKAFSTDRGYGPEPAHVTESSGWGSYRWGGDEFGYLDGAQLPGLGAKIEF